ncbi:Oidioi.mRNA.OKI2018_I69.chr2.g6361.t1.cds [Oikopleura dioica]|uniref:Oidioi.mRNA.OKI2018_I69.chr2.g6361.t1.cds n=1 Tax=Oikopleura dioica TaxID=34765 RepID=A0ABN7T511_OIKDI|nr:Oidioi.mRNA.OKI2018_I69.chr2.g6361.t1.cds [Oikopleura dioica]
MANEELIALIFTSEGGIALNNIEFEFRDTYCTGLDLEGYRDVQTLLEKKYKGSNDVIPYSNQISEDSSKAKWEQSGPPWTILITSLGFCSQETLQNAFLRHYSSWSGIHKPRFQKENKKCTFFARFDNMKEADDLKVFLHRYKDMSLKVQFVTSYALPNQKEMRARESGNTSYYKDEARNRKKSHRPHQVYYNNYGPIISGQRRHDSPKISLQTYLEEPSTGASDSTIKATEVIEEKIPLDMIEGGVDLTLRPEVVCLPLSELGIRIVRPRELRGLLEHDLIPWHKFPSELMLEMPPEDFLVEVTAKPFVDFEENKVVLEDVPLRIHCKLVNSLFVVSQIGKKDGVLVKHKKSGDIGWARGEIHENVKLVVVFNLNKGQEFRWKIKEVEVTPCFAGIPCQTIIVEVQKGYNLRTAPKIGDEVLIRHIKGNEKRKQKRFIFATAP